MAEREPVVGEAFAASRSRTRGASFALSRLALRRQGPCASQLSKKPILIPSIGATQVEKAMLALGKRTDRELAAPEATPFPTEDELQSLTAEHPELFDGEQIRPGDARRWILVTREKGIAPSTGEAARWAVDHLIIDQDAVPMLAEVKRGSNPEIRRTIVGKLPLSATTRPSAASVEVINRPGGNL